MSDAIVHSVSLMGTVVTIEVVGRGNTPEQRVERAAGVERAVEWFRVIEECCTRFDERSELRRLCARVGEAVPVSEMLFQVVQFALAIAEDSEGAFDPTVGHAMESADAVSPGGDYRNVRVNPVDRTVTLLKPMLLDLGAVAKGLAVDAAARELQQFHDFAVDAGGDLYLGGSNARGEPWSVGIRHPRDAAKLLETLHLSDTAVCTSGDYERKRADGSHHIVDPRSAQSPTALASVTVIAPSAMVADALGTAAFVLGPINGLALLERHGVRGIMVTPMLERFETRA